MIEDMRMYARAPLEEKEFKVLRLVRNGLTSKEIANKLRFCNSKEVDHLLGGHELGRRSVYNKIGVTNRVQAAAWVEEVDVLYSLLVPQRQSKIYYRPCNSIAVMTNEQSDCRGLEIILDPEDSTNGNSLRAGTTHTSSIKPILGQDQVSTFFSERLRSLYQVGVRGQPLQARRDARYLGSLVQMLASRCPDERTRYALDRVRARALHEFARTLIEACPVNDVMNATVLVKNAIFEIADNWHDEELYGLSWVVFANACYLANRYAEGVNAYKEAWTRLTEPNDKHQILRGLDITYALAGDSKAFLDNDAQLMSLIQEGKITHPDYIISGFEASGRGHYLLRDQLRNRAYLERVEEAQQIYDRMQWQGGEPIFRFIQLGRTWWKLADDLERRDQQIQKRIKKAIHLSNKHGFVRYLETMLGIPSFSMN